MVDSQSVGFPPPLPMETCQVIETRQTEGAQPALKSVVSLLYDLIQTVGQAADFPLALKQMVQQVCHHTDWVFGEVWLPSADQQLLYNSGVWGASEPPLEDFAAASQKVTFSPGQGLPGRVWLTGQPEWIIDVATVSKERFYRCDLALAAGLRTGVGVPIKLKQEIAAVLTFFKAETCREDHQQVELISAIATQIGAVLRLIDIQTTLRDRERFLRLVLDNIPQQLFWKDCEGAYLGCNQIFAHHAGFTSPAEIVGLTDSDIGIYSEADVAYFRARDQQLLEQQTPILQMIQAQPYADGSKRWISANKVPIHDGNGQVIGILGTLEDISDRLATQQAINRREQYLTALVEVQRQLLALEGIWDSSRYLHLLQPLGRASNASRVYIYELDAQNRNLHQRAEWLAPHIATDANSEMCASIPYPGAFAEWMAVLRQGGVVNQIQSKFPPLADQALASSHVKSILLFPLQVNGQFRGLIGFSDCCQLRTWNRSEVALLQIAAAAVSLAIERHQVELSLRRAESKYRSIFENAVEGIFQSTLDGRYLTANPMLARLYGYDSPEELIRTITNIRDQLYVKGDRRDVFIQIVLQHGSILGFEAEVYRRDGTIIWIAESARLVRDAQGQAIGFEGTVENITARKRAETDLRQRDRLLEGVAQASQHLLTNTDLASAIPTVLSIVGIAAGADRAYVYEQHSHHPTGVAAMSMRYEWTQPGITPSIQQPHWQNLPFADHGLERWHQAFLAGLPVRGVVRDLPKAEQQLLQRDHIEAILMVPIFINQDFWGYIGFDTCQPERLWNASEESILVRSPPAWGAASSASAQRTKFAIRRSTMP
ncbi:MAG: PAS domain S-box protein [Leptolyngbya sp. RL_3_1]|nr:PAS domain S-box protein [Leptolyngbya sp. RL_3_1]